MTQRSLSQAVGFKSLAHLSDIESGKRNPAKETLPKFAKALGVSLADIESHDMRGPIEAAKVLFARRPEMVGAFLKIIEAAKKMEAEELIERVMQKREKPAEGQAPVVAASVAASVSADSEAPVSKPQTEKKLSAQPTLF